MDGDVELSRAGALSPGRFVVFEGLDGAGTSTQVAAMGRWLAALGAAVEVTREPSKGPFGATIRQALDGRIALDPVSMALAFAADRTDHLNNTAHGIRCTLERGRWVLCDRYVLSNLAYQGSVGVDLDWLKSINTCAPAPDLTIFIDTSPSVCVERLQRRSAHEEMFHNIDDLERTLSCYRRVLAEGNFVRELITVDGNQSEEAVTREIVAGVRQWLARLATAPRPREESPIVADEV